MTPRTPRLIVAVLSAVACSSAQAQSLAPPAGPAPTSWRQTLDQRLAEFGHRNWIAIVDSAYPAQTSPGVETIVTQGDHLSVLKHALQRLSAARHVRPIIYLDAELDHVAESDAPGIDALRSELTATLADRQAQRLPHGQIIERLDAAGQKFRVLVLKTDLALPYTSVFIELDCGYWSEAAEQRLRQKLAGAK
jgi:hypothetical protein